MHCPGSAFGGSAKIPHPGYPAVPGLTSTAARSHRRYRSHHPRYSEAGLASTGYRSHRRDRHNPALHRERHPQPPRPLPRQQPHRNAGCSHSLPRSATISTCTSSRQTGLCACSRAGRESTPTGSPTSTRPSSRRARRRRRRARVRCTRRTPSSTSCAMTRLTPRARPPNVRNGNGEG